MPVGSTGYVNFRAAPGSITTLREDDYFHNRQIVALGRYQSSPRWRGVGL
jgi:2,3-bisphosphoglycerate-dependent phosphoglycerate mutase